MLNRVRILVAGMGNVLRGDDGFGVVVVQRLVERPLPPAVRVIEVGIGGIHLVQELLERPDVLVVVDAIDLGRDPGTVLVVRPDVEDVSSLPLLERHDRLADMHWTSPQRAFLLARGLGVLPATTWLIGCQPEQMDELGEGLSARVLQAVDPAITELRTLVEGMGVRWPS